MILLTKPLGTQVAVHAYSLLSKRKTGKQTEDSEAKLAALAELGITERHIEEAYHLAVASMMHLNRNAAMCLQKYREAIGAVNSKS